MQERDTGVAADPIKPLKMKSEKHGDFPGGYWPIKYDKMRSNIEGHIAAKSDLFDKHYVQAVTPQAYTEARTQFAAPLDLSGQLIGSHIRGMIHDIAFREAVRNAAKLINNAEFMAAMTQKWSKEYAGLLPGWIKDIANAQRVDDSYAMGAARWSALVRQNITSTLIALNPGTVIKHGMSALGMSIERVGAKELGSAAVELGAKAMIQSANELIKGKGEPPTQERLDALKAVTDPSEIGDQVRQFIIDSSAVMRNGSGRRRIIFGRRISRTSSRAQGNCLLTRAMLGWTLAGSRWPCRTRSPPCRLGSRPIRRPWLGARITRRRCSRLISKSPAPTVPPSSATGPGLCGRTKSCAG
jgi:hypothetical protein